MFAVVLAACSSGSSSGDPEAQVATLRIFAGTVEVGTAGQFTPGSDGQTVSEGDTVRTGADGRAAIEYFDGSVTRLDHDTIFSIVTLQILGNDQGSTVIEGEQGSGNTYNRVTELTDSESRFDIETPTAVASVQGTVYAIIFNPDGSMTVAVLEGSVVVTSDGDEIVVPEGFMVTIEADGTIGDLVPIPDQLLDSEWIVFNQCELDDVGDCEIEAVVASIELTPESSTIAAGESQSYSVEAFDEDGHSLGDVTGDAVITGTDCAGNECSPTAIGTHGVTAEFMDFTDTATLTVEAGPVTALEITPEAATISAGGSQAFSAEAFDAFGNSLGPVAAEYSLLGGTCTGADCSSTSVGDHTVTGVFDGVSDTSTLTVEPGPLSYILISPGAATIRSGQSQAYSARGYDAYGNPRGPVPASFEMTNGSCSGSKCTGGLAGVQIVTGTFSGKADTATLTVTVGPLHHIVISPDGASIEAGGSQGFTAVGYDAHGNSRGPVAATYDITNGTCAGANCTSTVAGNRIVTGTFSGKVDTATLIVTPGPIEEIVISPQEATIQAGQSQAYTAEGFDAYGNSAGLVEADYTAYPIYPDSEAHRTFGAREALAFGGGLVCDGPLCGPTSAGLYAVAGVYDDLVGSAVLEVNPGPADAVELYPNIAELPYCGSQWFYGYIVDSYGNLVDTDALVTFADVDGVDSNLDYGEGPTITADSGYFELLIYGEQTGPVSLRASTGGILSNIIVFDVVAEGCVD